ARAAFSSATTRPLGRACTRRVARTRPAAAKRPPPQLRSADTDFESFFNNFAPFYYSAVLYLCVFLLAALSWLVWTAPLNRAAFLLTLVALALPSFALVSRMYISGRPPVTKPYATAVFIRWGFVSPCPSFQRVPR